MRGKCHYCLFDYKSAYIDISECLEIHKSEKSKMGKKDETSSVSYKCPAWISDFHAMLGKKVSGTQGNNGVNMAAATPVTTHLNHLSRMISSELDP